MTKILFVITISLLSIVAFAQNKPNVVVILVDDMGYSDIGCYGGEIPTPNIDKLAEKGIRYTNFYNTSRCCPTRAALLTGLNQHQTGIGHMTSEGSYDFDYGVDGYRGNLNRNCITIAEVLKTNGYSTFMTGKWHLGSEMDDRPLQRGFDKYYGCLRGAFNYFAPGDKYSWGNEFIEQPDPETYYTTDAFTDTATNWILNYKNDNPFFLYMAYNAPHWPLHAKTDDVKKFVGKYMNGWDEVRKKRLERQIEMGLFSEVTKMAPRDSNVRSWSEVNKEQKVHSDFRMAVYAAQVFCVDENVGKLVDALHKKGIFDNTIIIFLSDNGACAEPYNEFGGNKFENINKKNVGGIVSIGRGWANACNTPLREYKNRPNQGGILTPCIMQWPNGINKDLEGGFNRQSAHVMDLMPTVLEITGTEYPLVYNNNLIHPFKGVSLSQAFLGKEHQHHEYLIFEHENNCAVIKGDWKIMGKFEKDNWELYNLNEDPTELNNLADKYPDLVRELVNEWRRWALANKVVPKGNSENKGYKSPKE